ncbi:MAG: flavodoxin [Candidatus Omnitrophota bacterium]
MKSVVIYYSFSGNTRLVAVSLREFLSLRGEVDFLDLKVKDESSSFLGQAARAFRHIKADLQPVNFNLQQYDLICFGSPVWAFGPAPAINAYLDKCYGLENKKVVLFTTYGSGTGNKRCLDYMQGIVRQKGAGIINRFSIQQFKIKEKDFILSEIRKILPL